jgi:hypothetical protein
MSSAAGRFAEHEIRAEAWLIRRIGDSTPFCDGSA